VGKVGGAPDVLFDMTRPTHLIGAMASVAVLGVVAGCGGSSSSSSSSAPQPKSSGSAAIVSTKSVAGVGSVLVDASGKTLYSPAQEAGGNIMCTRACTGVWPPLTVGSAKALAANDMGGKLSTVKRADGTLQVAYNGAPLYRFKFDKRVGSASGNGAHDKFGSTRFNWKALTVAGKPAAKSKPAPSTSSNSGGGAYGY
jgi:predicted lipoprotein with Yx(FWY)xxD motif